MAIMLVKRRWSSFLSDVVGTMSSARNTAIQNSRATSTLSLSASMSSSSLLTSGM